MSTVVPQITSVPIVCPTVGSGADQRRDQSSASLAFVRGIHRWTVNSPHKRPVTRKMFAFDAVTMKMKKLYTFWVVNMNPARLVYGAFRREDVAVLEHPSYYDVLSDQNPCRGIFTCTMHPLLILMACMVDASHGVSIKANYELGPPGVFLHCISISSRSSVECALRASVMDIYGNQFAYRDGQCHACRPDNVNCAVSEDEYLLAGPHHFRGRFMVYPNK